MSLALPELDRYHCSNLELLTSFNLTGDAFERVAGLCASEGSKGGMAVFVHDYPADAANHRLTVALSRDHRAPETCELFVSVKPRRSDLVGRRSDERLYTRFFSALSEVSDQANQAPFTGEVTFSFPRNRFEPYLKGKGARSARPVTLLRPQGVPVKTVVVDHTHPDVISVSMVIVSARRLGPESAAATLALAARIARSFVCEIGETGH